jgi:hypothetical protein
VSYFWKEAKALSGYRTGISLHSHTSQSHESLNFLREMSRSFLPLKWILATQKRKIARVSAIEMDLATGYWTPPLSPRAAFELEKRQIEDQLDLEAIVSLSDHDNIEAGQLLQVVPVAKEVPISLEWTVPYLNAGFHLGVHNLPAAHAPKIMADLAAYTANPEPECLLDLFETLHANREVLIVLNHPLWDLWSLKQPRFGWLLTDFLNKHLRYIHAFELNGLRCRTENREVAQLAFRWNQPVISGGDRHGCEPNANVNLTNAGSFAEFVEEIRVRRQSHVMFMPQYAAPYPLRCFQTFADAIREYPDLPGTARFWDDRVFHSDRYCVSKPFSTLWSKPPRLLNGFFRLAQNFEGSKTRGLLAAAGRNPSKLRVTMKDRQEA